MVLITDLSSVLGGDQLPLFTKSRVQIENEQPLEVDERILRFRKESLISQFKDCDFRSVSNRYNCVGMVFANRRAFIKTDKIQMILDGDFYDEVGESQAFVGDVITYQAEKDGEFTHVGLVQKIEKNILGNQMYVLSKWGNDVEMVHKPLRLPGVYGNILRFWSERKSL